jgi:membrane protease subunit HflK
MAWNQPGDEKSRPPRAAAGGSGLDESLRRWQRRAQQLWQPGSGGPFWVILALAVLAWLASGFYQIGTGERGVIQRFGAYVSTEQPGHGWHLPWPIETLARVNVGAVASVDAKSLMLSADGNLLNIAWSAQYRIDEPLQYLFQVRDQEAMLRQAAESAVRMAVGRFTLAQLLGGGDARRGLTDDAQAAVQKTLNDYHSGLKLTTVNLFDVQVPDPVLAAQRDATKAAEDRMRSRQEAQGYANDILPKAEAVARRQVQDAEAYKAQVVAAAEGDSQRFTQLASAYAAAPELTRSRMYIETMEAVLSRAHKIILDTKPGSSSTIYLPLDKLIDAMRTPSGAPAPSPAASERPGSDAGGATDETRSRDRER